MVTATMAPTRRQVEVMARGWLTVRETAILLENHEYSIRRRVGKGTLPATRGDDGFLRVSTCALYERYAELLADPLLRERTLDRLRTLASAAGVELDFEKLALARKCSRTSAN